LNVNLQFRYFPEKKFATNLKTSKKSIKACSVGPIKMALMSASTMNFSELDNFAIRVLDVWAILDENDTQLCQIRK